MNVLGKSTPNSEYLPYLNENNLSYSAKNMLKEGGEGKAKLNLRKPEAISVGFVVFIRL
jgi:hypothetical protein